MKEINPVSGLILVMAVLAVEPTAHPQATFEQLSGKSFDSAVPKDFYLEGNAIPTEKRNAALLRRPPAREYFLP